VLLRDGRVLLSGGTGDSLLASAEIYRRSRVGFTAIASLGSARSNHTATVLPDGRVLIAGGSALDGSTQTTELFFPDSDRFISGAAMLAAREGHTATLLHNGSVLIAGGTDGRADPPLSSTEVYSQ
jgi:hypothetical protein